ncbi:MAG: hypothetical protein NT007_08240 [Candidatus Kapabacteria bacterium]|nr:hypothetical protein [Candidatus Kapabacteria bacterium]
MKNLFIIIFLMYSSFLFSFSGKGSGTHSDPYQITTMSELQEVNDDTRSSYILMNDLDAKDYEFKLINLYKGELNGNGHIIRNLKYCGLISSYCIGCTVTKLGIEYDTCYYGSGLVLMTDGGVKISECYTSGVMINAQTGFCLFNYSGFINNCYSSCTLTNTSGKSTIGFLGSIGNSYNCYFSGYLEGEGTRNFFNYGSNNYWNKDYYPDADSFKCYGIPKTSAEMMKRSTYKGWDFDSVWCIDEGKDYPRLRAFNKCAPVSVQESDADNRQQPVVQSIEISPNPATDDLKITVGTRRAVSLHISLYSALGEDLSCIIEDGRVLAVSEINSGIYKYSKSISSRQLSSGMYYVRIKTDYRLQL